MSRRAVAFGLVVVVAVGAGVYFVVTGSSRGTRSIGAEALALPDQTELLVGADLRQLLPALRRLGGGGAGGLAVGPEARDVLVKAIPALDETLREIEARTGISAERDVTHLAVAFWDLAGDAPKWAAVLSGRFDPDHVLAAVERGARAANQPVLVGEVQGARAVTWGGQTLALPAARLVVAGDTAGVETTLANRARGQDGVRAWLGYLLSNLKPSTTAWAFGAEAFGNAVKAKASPDLPAPALFGIEEAPGTGVQILLEMNDTATAEAVVAAVKKEVAAAGGVPVQVDLQMGKGVRIAARQGEVGTGGGAAQFVAAVVGRLLRHRTITVNPGAE